jgi:hypothetical protein
MFRRFATFLKRIAVLAVVAALVIGYLSSGFGPGPSETSGSQIADASKVMNPP